MHESEVDFERARLFYPIGMTGDQTDDDDQKNGWRERSVEGRPCLLGKNTV